MSTVRELPPEYLENCPVIDRKYKVLFKLGTGRFSKVRMAICLATNTRVAIKIMNERDNEEPKHYDYRKLKSFLNEIKMCANSKHRNIIRIIDFEVCGIYKSPDGSAKYIMYYVMKIAQNGELHRLIKESEIFTEKLARTVFKQLLAAVEFLHNSRVSHRDIKAENILIDEHMNVKLADFGCASYFIDFEHNKIELDSSEAIGTLKSNAPELTNSSKQGVYHGDEVDLFACGYVLFEMVMKAEPFKSSNHQDKHYKELAEGNFDSFWKIFSSQCKPSNDFKGKREIYLDLLQRLFDPNPKTRIDLNGVKKHPWYVGEVSSRNEYKKEMRVRLKKVMMKMRKEQEEEIKSFFKQERCKTEFASLSEIKLGRELESEIQNIRELIRQNDHSDSSSNASNADAKETRENEDCGVKVKE